MNEAAEPTPAPDSRGKGLTLIGVLGEILITLGVLILLFLGWQLWFNNLVFNAAQEQAATELSEEWESQSPTPTPEPSTSSDPGEPQEPVVIGNPPSNKAFANLIIPRLGAEYRHPVAEGIGTLVLNSQRLGIGHYPQTQLPGEVGNFALAAHRSAYGGAFHNIHQLVVGDSIYVETADGWYRYVFRGLEYVRASGVGVLLPVPQDIAATPQDRLITLTTCNPFYSSAERIVGYGLFDSWYPRSEGPPAEIAEITSKAEVG